MSSLYKLGAEDAKANFGITHGTPKPPATWTQKWLETPVKNVNKRLTIPSMQESSNNR